MACHQHPDYIPYKAARAQLLDTFDRAYVVALMARHDDNATRAAQAAGVSRSFLYHLLLKARDRLPDSATRNVPSSERTA